ncbi:hypothetical protein K144313037_02260 [Clostridium tetani]|uniref:YeeE/YedE thiosulfate transporter family protein n=1 Tax=Clostridium tetani TaxID=1513 RepID=UPI00100B4316|nr:YeeE/YedE thiosulfate transporter family protein [Clostridium tetani]RXI47812.1 transporter [Clostridium tetani]RXI74876.1 transporter [Clostridium tetani]RXM61110.1 transporter [Clostridium tetani]RXM69637.1 transporter [Clostridium tetani]BDR68814.1 hypothetical protein K144313037_02260 [Clostridium tetani]
MQNEMDKLIEERQGKLNKKKNQTPYGVIISFIILILCCILFPNQYKYAICLGAGVIIGIILRYSRFCFAAAFRDPFISRNTALLRGMILAMMVSTIGFAVIQSGYTYDKVINYDLIPGAVSSVGIHVMIGAFIFGIGMVFAGGCASGVLMRIGEGHALHLVVLLGFIIGTLLGARDYSFWYHRFIKNAKTIYFSEYMDLKYVVFTQIIVLIILYRLALWYENKSQEDI